jgi:hypothetical protein
MAKIEAIVRFRIRLILISVNVTQLFMIPRPEEWKRTVTTMSGRHHAQLALQGATLPEPMPYLFAPFHLKTVLIRNLANSAAENTVSANGKRGAAVATASRTMSFDPKGTSRIWRTV